MDRRLTPLAFSLARQSTVSSSDQEKFLNFQTTMTSKGGFSPVASPIIVNGAEIMGHWGGVIVYH